ncbi:MAG TPA: MarR family winged helix-turn-helix transcriptional regulator [Microbacterium sp.]|uniref:MarR family winged helix-turn-helix transcriptional regulator n=1 Tax=Microbacterium sp. TaxID=51671 RepID=UPI002B47441C|nr:MarR family winged helix-turn-helix transcriptional regulator [Microbacterium sp.]HKT57833.1 MarR family winged helix-turn-helix transcriptional regulator [Microbacterium sp.]
MPQRSADRDALRSEAAGRPFSPVIALLTVSSVWDAHLGAALKPLGLTTRKYGLLAHIRATPDISFSELARRSQITVQTAHTAVHALVDDGMVSDGTAIPGAPSHLRMTEKGARALTEADSRLADLDTALGTQAPAFAAALRGMHEEPVGAK